MRRLIAAMVLFGLSITLSLLGFADDKPADEKKAPLVLSPLEKKFQETLQDAVFAGKWRLLEHGKLGGEQEDKYTIRSAAKVGEDTWMVGARIQYGDKDLTLPVPVKVFWAGDTPVITITNFGFPGLGTFTARVLVYDGCYTGTWSGPGHAGFLTGVISKAAIEPEKGEKEKEKAKTGE